MYYDMNLKRIKRRIKYFFDTFPLFSQLWNEYHNPIYYWWKAKKYFKFPSIRFYKGKKTWFFGLPIRNEYYNRFIDIRFSGLGWKDKYDSPRLEWQPYISILFFRKYQLIWSFVYEPDHTWEAILDFLYYSKSISKAIENNTWTRIPTGEKITVINNVKKID